MELVVDANVWLSACSSQEPFHHDSIAFLKAGLEGNFTFLLPALIFPEISGTASRRTRNTEDGIALVKQLQQLPNVLFFELNQQRSQQASQLASRLFLRGADAQYAALALERNAPLITLDRELLERTNGVVNCQSPAEWLNPTSEGL